MSDLSVRIKVQRRRRPPVRSSQPTIAAHPVMPRSTQEANLNTQILSPEREADLRMRMESVPNGSRPYPFKDFRLEREDVRFLVATYTRRVPQYGVGILTLSPQHQALDLRGAVLNGVDLSGLTLAGVVFGSPSGPQPDTEEGQLQAAEEEKQAAAHLRGAILHNTSLRRAVLPGVDLRDAHIERSDFRNARLVRARMNGAKVNETQFQQANLFDANLRGSMLWRCRFEGTSLVKANLVNSDLRWSHFDGMSDIAYARIVSEDGVGPVLADVHWNDLALTPLDWRPVKRTGDETRAEKDDLQDNAITNWTLTVRACRQLSIALRAQGLIEEADHFSYHARVLSRKHLLRQMDTTRGWLFSILLEKVAGYGYRPLFAFGWYLALLSVFGLIYLVLDLHAGEQVSAALLNESFVQSVAAFHGRSLFSPAPVGSQVQNLIAACEAMIGLVMEAILVATFIQRIFSR